MTSQEIFYLASATAAWVAFAISLLSYFRARHEEKAKLYLDLRGRYLEIRRRVPDRYLAAGADIKENDPDWVHLEQYWYQSFDEWFSTTQLNRGKHSDLWDMYFGPAIQSTLKYRAMRKVAWHMTKGHVSFGNYKDSYRAMLDGLWRDLDKDNSKISDGFVN